MDAADQNLTKLPESGVTDAAGAPSPSEPLYIVAANDEPGWLNTPWITWGLVAFALVLRLAWLGMKPPHFDEGVNGWFIDQMTKQGYYHYDPANYHGPFHFYILFLAQTLLGRSVVALRLPLVFINSATVWLLLQFRKFLPTRVCVLAALACAVSPGMVFYSRYAIHESWFVFGMVLLLWGLAELWKCGTARGLWAAMMGATLLVLTKETYIIHFAAFALAAGTLALLERFVSTSSVESSAKPALQQWSARTFGQVCLVAVLLILFFYSGGFLDPQHDCLQRMARSITAWIHTGAQGHGPHEKPFYYWLQLIGIYELPCAIGLLFSVRALFPGMNRLSRFTAIYGCGTLVAYSLVNYKTPWCIISIIWPFLFLFGDALNSLCSTVSRTSGSVLRGRQITGILAAIALAVSFASAVRLNYFRPTDPAEKYVYVQTLNDLFRLTDPLNRLVAKDPTAYHMPANILLSSYHPLPWVLGEFTAIGYYDSDKIKPPVMDAGFLLVEQSRVADVEDALKERYFVEPFQLRDAMDGGKLYLSCKRFSVVFPGRKPDFYPGIAASPAVDDTGTETPEPPEVIPPPTTGESMPTKIEKVK